MKLSRTAALIVVVLIAPMTPDATGKSSAKMTATPPNTAYLQKIWNGWSTLNPDNVAQFYASGLHTFFDIAPLKYQSWQEYESGVRKVLADFKQANFNVNDDAELHPAGNQVWGTATVKYELKHQDGKVDMGNLRWTVVFEREGGKWLIVHEHVSMPIQ